MAECNIEESIKANGVAHEGADEMDAMSFLYMILMAKHLEDATEKGSSAFGKGDK